MLDREAVAARLAGNGISYTEFSYQLLQSYDYLQLHQQYGCTLQTGGSDQWGNIVAGVDLVRRVTGHRVHALTTPLVTKADGTKFGKTESGTVWLDAALTSPYAFYQFWLNTEDAIVPHAAADLLVPHARARSRRSRSRCASARRRARPSARWPQELTDLVHGPDERARVEAAAKALFGQGELADLDLATLEAALAEAPHAVVHGGGVGRGPQRSPTRSRAAVSWPPRAPAGARSPRAAPTSRNVRVTDETPS